MDRPSNFLVAPTARLRIEVPEADYGKPGTLDQGAAYLSARAP